MGKEIVKNKSTQYHSNNEEIVLIFGSKNLNYERINDSKKGSTMVLGKTIEGMSRKTESIENLRKIPNELFDYGFINETEKRFNDHLRKIKNELK